MNQVIFLMGPTASGKTDLAIELSKHLNLDLISVDSALIYKDMNIGTAKPEREILEKYPHQLIDIISPENSYNAAEFSNDATQRSSILQLANAIADGSAELFNLDDPFAVSPN